MRLHLLGFGGLRPDRRLMGGLALHGQRHRAVRGGQVVPVGIVLVHGIPEQLGVEARETRDIGGREVDRGDAHPRGRTRGWRDAPTAHPIVIRVDQLHLACPRRLAHAHPELRRDPIDVGHVDIDEAWRAGVARVFREVDDRVVASQPDIERQVRLETVLELDLEPQPGPPRDRHPGISDPQNGSRVGPHQKTDTRSAGSSHMPSPSPTPNASWKASMLRTRWRGTRRRVRVDWQQPRHLLARALAATPVPSRGRSAGRR
jgi:hypothetical protein